MPQLFPSTRSRRSSSATAALDGTLALSEGKWLDLVHGGHHGFLAVLANDAGGTLVGYAQATRGGEGWGLEVVSDPRFDQSGSQLRDELLRTRACDELAREGGRVHYWVPDPSEDLDLALATMGFTPDRDLIEMRVDLPLASTVRTGPPIAVRPFRPGPRRPGVARDEQPGLRRSP